MTYPDLQKLPKIYRKRGSNPLPRYLPHAICDFTTQRKDTCITKEEQEEEELETKLAEVGIYQWHP